MVLITLCLAQNALPSDQTKMFELEIKEEEKLAITRKFKFNVRNRWLNACWRQYFTYFVLFMKRPKYDDNVAQLNKAKQNK